jgi:branched-chain amino acid transport system permease protein
MQNKYLRYLVPLLCFLGFLLIFQNTLDSFKLRIFNLCGIYVIFAVSMNLVNGFTGQFSLGHSGFIAVGAYAYSLLVMSPDVKTMNFFLAPIISPLAEVQLPFSVAILIAGLVAAFAGYLVGAPVLRLRGDYLAIATLGFSEIIRIVFTNTQTLTNGALGLKGIPLPKSFMFLEMKGAFIWWVWIIALITIIVHFLLINSSYGRAFKAIREDEKAAQAMGISLFNHKVLSLIVSAFFAGVGGALLASLIGTIDPLMFRFFLTYNILLIVVIGGMGSISGSAIGAVVVTILMEVLRPLDQGFWILPEMPGLRMVVFSIMLLACILFYPNGIMGNKELSWSIIKQFGRKVSHRSKEVS